MLPEKAKMHSQCDVLTASRFRLEVAIHGRSPVIKGMIALKLLGSTQRQSTPLHPNKKDISQRATYGEFTPKNKPL